jgi:hypothetical protein
MQRESSPADLLFGVGWENALKGEDRDDKIAAVRMLAVECEYVVHALAGRVSLSVKGGRVAFGDRT